MQDYSRLPNDCLLIALRAVALLRDTPGVSWVKALAIRGSGGGNEPVAHAVTVFETDGKVIWCYDEGGVLSLDVPRGTRDARLVGASVFLHDDKGWESFTGASWIKFGGNE